MSYFPEPVGSLINGTSDHTPTIYHIKQKSSASADYKETLPIRLMTWNKMDKCESAKKSRYGFKNNPWNIDEKRNEYAQRNKLQLHFLIKSICEAKDRQKPLHIICLQEVKDFIFDQPELKQSHKEFEESLTELGWQIVKSCKEDGCKPFVVLYDTKRLHYVEQKGIFPVEDRPCCGLEVHFHDIINLCPYAAANVHFNYDVDFRKAVVKYQMEQIEEGILTTICGDTNHPPGLDQESFIGNPELATNIDFDPNEEAITTQDLRSMTPKRYDTIAVSPAKGHSAYVLEKNGAYFAANDEGKIEIRSFNPKTDFPASRKHYSQASEPWISQKGRHLLAEDELQQSDDAAVAVKKDPSTYPLIDFSLEANRKEFLDALFKKKPPTLPIETRTANKDGTDYLVLDSSENQVRETLKALKQKGITSLVDWVSQEEPRNVIFIATQKASALFKGGSIGKK